MLLNTLESLKGITDVTPHSLKSGPLKQNEISKDLINRLVDFVKSINNKIITISPPQDMSKDELVNEFADYTQMFKQIQMDIVAEIPSKNGGMRIIPEEYVEVIYIVTYQMCKHLDLKQVDAAKILNLKERDFKDRFGISPASDCKIKQADCRFTLPVDYNKEELKDLVSYVNSYLAELSNSYFIGVSNRMSLFANTENLNKSVNRKVKDSPIFYGRQFYYSISSIQDLYDWIFIEHIVQNSTAVKEKVQNFLCTDDVEMNEEVLEFLLTCGVEIKAENLNQNDYKGFQRKYKEYLAKIKDKELWMEVIEHPEIPYDELLIDMKDWTEDKAVDREAYAMKRIADLEKHISKEVGELLDYIDINSFKTEDTLKIYRYLVERYNSSLVNFKPELLKDKDSFCAKYLISRYFSINGVSTETITDLNNYLSSKELSSYINRYKNDYISAFKDGVDINDKVTLLGKIRLLNAEIKGRKEKRTIARSVILIDADCYPVNSALVEKISKVNSEFYLLIISSKELELPILIKEKINNTYIYTTEREHE